MIIKPTLLLDFVNARQIGAQVTFARASASWRTNPLGALEMVPSGMPVIDYDPLTLECLGLRVWEARTNLLLNSATLSTQSVTVTNVAHALSFYGSGTVTLSGAASGIITGSGAYPAKTTYLFTPTAGALTLTVSGSVTFAQLEAGANASPYINTAGSQVTRAADAPLITSIGKWFNPAEGTFAATFAQNPVSANARFVWSVGDNTTINESMRLASTSPTAAACTVNDGGVEQVSSALSGALAASNSAAMSYQAGNFNFCLNGGTITTDSAGTLPTVNTLGIGKSAWDAGNQLNGHIKRLAYFPKSLSANLQELSR